MLTPKRCLTVFIFYNPKLEINQKLWNGEFLFHFNDFIDFSVGKKKQQSCTPLETFVVEICFCTEEGSIYANCAKVIAVIFALKLTGSISV